MACVPLNGLDIATAQLELQRGAGMPKRVEYHGAEPVFFNQLGELLVDHTMLVRMSVDLSHY